MTGVHKVNAFIIKCITSESVSVINKGNYTVFRYAKMLFDKDSHSDNIGMRVCRKRS